MRNQKDRKNLYNLDIDYFRSEIEKLKNKKSEESSSRFYSTSILESMDNKLKFKKADKVIADQNRNIK